MNFQEFLTEQNITLIVSVVVGLCSVASAALELAGKTTASKIVGGLPTAIDLGGLLRWLARGKAKTKDAAVKAVGAGIVLALLSGCAGTLDNARGQIKPALGAPKAAASARRCEQLSDRETLWGAIAEAGAIATGSGGLATLPIDDESIRRAVIGATVVVAIGTGAAIYVTRKAAQQYVVERCATEASAL